MASPTGLAPSTNSSGNMSVTAPEKLLAACPCLNVKLHLAEPSESSISGTETKLGLAGVSVEQKILCSMSIAGDQAAVHCNNCNHIVYTFPTLSLVQLEPTSLAFLNSSILFSPSSGFVVPSESIVTGDGIAALLKDTHYSKSFRLVLTPSSSSPTEASSSTISTSINSTSQHLYQPHLERVRTLLDKELEANISAQQQQTEARIEAYKSQQQIALQESIASTRQEKERLWAKIQDRVSTPPPPSVGEGHVNSSGLQPDSPLENGTHPFDGPSTLPIRLTSVSRDGLHGSLVDRRKSAVAEMAMSHQFREFDQRMASNSMRRQSLVPGSTPLPPAGLAPAPERSALSTSHASAASEASHDSSTSPAPKSKKRVTIVDAVSIVEPVSHDEEEEPNIIGERSTFYSGNDDEDDDGEDRGVVFDLDEELGFDGEGQQDGFDEDSDNDFTNDDNKDLNGGEGSSTNGSASISISISRASLPKSGMVVGSLRANYLRRQRGLELHKKSLTDGPLGDGEDDDDLEDGGQPMAYFGTSLPIQIQARPPAILPPPARTSAIASSLAMPPGSSPAAAMLQRRLSRAYGNDNTPEPQTGRLTNHRGSVSNLASSLADVSLNIPGTAPGTVIIDPLMLLEEEHDADDREDRLRKHRQQFSSINHRRDLEQRQHELDSTTTITTTSTTTVTTLPPSSSFSQSLARSAQADFEPPHVFSARTYVGSTPWEMPTRITVKSGGYQREGTHLDKQIALEMAQEQEKERKELARLHSAVVDASVAHQPHQQLPRHVVDKIEEGEEEIDEEDEEAKKPRTTLSSG
ncbi:hypothetical protein BG005_006995 [Podila minutissima]|nr:hypothetical protein BG005_006995 [Podila minutissima]